MHFSFTSATVALLGAQAVLGQVTVTPTNVSPAQTTNFNADIGSLAASLILQPQFYSLNSFLTAKNITSGFLPTGGATATHNFPSEISALNSYITGSLPNQSIWPTEQVAYAKSALQAFASVYNKDLDPKNSAATAVKVSNTHVAVLGGVLAATFAGMLAL